MIDDLTETQLAELKADLLALRDELNAALASTAASASTVDLDQPIGRVSRIDALQNQQIAKAGRRANQLRLKQIDAALRAWSAGDYGLCRVCDGDIGYGRLKARPEAPRCLECQQEAESRQ